MSLCVYGLLGSLRPLFGYKLGTFRLADLLVPMTISVMLYASWGKTGHGLGRPACRFASSDNSQATSFSQGRFEFVADIILCTVKHK